MHGDAALSEEIRNRVHPDSTLKGEANLLIMPNLDAANISFNLLKITGGEGVTIGPILLGARKPVHILTPIGDGAAAGEHDGAGGGGRCRRVLNAGGREAVAPPPAGSSASRDTVRVRAGTSHGASTSRAARAAGAALTTSGDARSMPLIAFHALRQPNDAIAPPASRSAGEMPAVAPPLISSNRSRRDDARADEAHAGPDAAAGDRAAGFARDARRRAAMRTRRFTRPGRPTHGGVSTFASGFGAEQRGKALVIVAGVAEYR